MGNHDSILNDDHTATLIRIKARQLCRRSDFSPSDLDDLKQGMRLYLLEKADLFDPARGSLEAFVTKAVNTWVAMLLRTRARHKRAGESVTVSLEGTILHHDGDATTLKAVVGGDSLTRRTLGALDDPLEDIDRRDAVAHVLSDLSNADRALLEYVADHGVSAAARKQNVSRRQIYNALARMRSRFEDAGLGAA